ncbi:GNAT family N-acetyltransferase [Salirhabdus sp. Marseille-P4669]|uniref:GNAT family N-acetyltransferase n=1 Tax=Salirhabdus sp. Marseille-P4669 TaxID=2042310 RepID=UPI000C7AA3FD|nr:GNAT family N-acetyltransferase [Salirhabdus sp. Marseille-P4669]
MDVIIEKANCHDAESLVRLYHDSYSENEELGFPTSASKVKVTEVQDWIQNTILMIVREKITNTIIAAVRLKYREDWQCYVLGRLAVKSAYKGKGIATKLMNYVESFLLERNEMRIRLTVAQTHPYLPKMYENKGYQIVGERVLDYLPYDEYIMEKVL